MATGVKVSVWKRIDSEYAGMEYVGELDIADLEPGMIVREIAPFREVTGKYTEDEEDYLIPLDNNEYYSPLLLQ